ncbi:MAG: carbohydrate binding domain-containing protein [Spirochaetales bacterium]|nr:carbohydrate binding domain-containing protein [Spirochaetales bacterium]
MKKENSRLMIVFAVLLFVMGLNSCVSAGDVLLEPGENMLVNGDFESGQDPWTPWVDEGWGGAGEVTWEDGIATLRIDEQGDECWAVAMHYKKILIEKGEKYVFRFKAKSDMNRIIRTNIGSGLAPSDPPYLYYQDIELTTEWQTYEFEFTMPFRTDKFGRIDFNCANNIGAFLPEGTSWTAEKLYATSGATVYIDDVELRKFVPVAE